MNNYGSGREIYVFRVPGSETVIPGDINKDGKVDGNDLTSYMNYTGLRSVDSDFDYVSDGDIDGNGLIDAYDISAVAVRLEGGIDTEEAITLGYDNARCEIVSSFDRPHRVFAEIIGSKGKIELPEFNAPVEARVYAGERVRELSGERGYRFEFDAFREDVRAGKTENALMPVADTLSVMETLDECRRQNKFTYPAEIEGV